MRLYRAALIASGLLAVWPLQAATPANGRESHTAVAMPVARPAHYSTAVKPLAPGSSVRLRTGPASITGARTPAHVAAPVINGSAMRRPRGSP